MKILTTVRRVPDLDAKFSLNSDNTEIETGSLDHGSNYFDEVALEEAIRLREGGADVEEIIAVCIGAKAATKQLRTALAMGADRAILILADEKKLDPYLVAALLAEIVDREEPDLILMGKLSVDYENNQAAQLLAGMKEYPQATFAYSTQVVDDGDSLIVGREVDGGTVTYKLPLPAVVTADLRLNEPRFPTLPNIMKAKRKPLQEIAVEDLGVDMETRIETVRFEMPPQREAGVIVESVEELVSKLQNDAKVL